MVEIFKKIIDICFIPIDAMFKFQIDLFNNNGGSRIYPITIGTLICGTIVICSSLGLIFDIIGLSKEE